MKPNSYTRYGETPWVTNSGQVHFRWGGGGRASAAGRDTHIEPQSGTQTGHDARPTLGTETSWLHSGCQEVGNTERQRTLHPRGQMSRGDAWKYMPPGLESPREPVDLSLHIKGKRTVYLSEPTSSLPPGCPATKCLWPGPSWLLRLWLQL